MKIPRSAVTTVVLNLLECPSLKRVTKYLDARTIVKCTRPRRPRKNARGETVVLTLGQPNYAERKFIKMCKAAGEPWPVRKVQLKWFPNDKKGS